MAKRKKVKAPGTAYDNWSIEEIIKERERQNQHARELQWSCEGGSGLTVQIAQANYRTAVAEGIKLQKALEYRVAVEG